MRHIIIDALNLINFDKDTQRIFNKSYEQGCNLFVEYMNAYALKFPKYKITAVFDGRLGEIYSGLKNLYLEESGNRIADRVIIEYIKNSVNPKLLTIISSDREILNFAKNNYCDYYRAEEFWLELKMAFEHSVTVEEIDEYNKPNLDESNFKAENNYLKYFDENPLDRDFMDSSFVKDKSSKNFETTTFPKSNNLKKAKQNSTSLPKQKLNADDELNIEKLKNRFDKNIPFKEEKKNQKKNINKYSSSMNEKSNELEDSFDDFLKIFNNKSHD